MSDSDSLDYLKTGFDPASLTVPRLRSILVSHDVEYPSGAKKPQLIQIFTDKVVPQSRKILATRARAKRTSMGIVDADSQESTTTTETTDATGDEEALMPPPPTPRTRTRRTPSRRVEESESDVAVSRSPTKRASRVSSKHPRASDTETDTVVEGIQRSVRKTRKSEVPAPVPVQTLPTPRIKSEEVDDRRVSGKDSPFTYDNPFQSGSSPISGSRDVSGERRRKSHAVTSSTRKSTSTSRRRTDAPKIDDGFHPPTSATFEIPISELNTLKDYDENGVEAYEEFTPEEQLELVRERSAKGLDALGPRRNKSQKTPGFNKSGPIWVVLITFIIGYATWYRQEKVAVGYCGVGRDAREVFPDGVEVPDWLRILAEPECEPCPPHAYCYSKLRTECEHDFILQPHPLSLGGIVPLPPTCEPDGRKVRNIKSVADKAVDALRERRAEWECGDLKDESGAPDPNVEIDEEALKKVVYHNKGKTHHLGAAEFEELWASAIGDVQGRDEVVSVEEGNRTLITSTSLAKIPYGCYVRKSFRDTLARHRLQIAAVIFFSTFVLYLRYFFRSRAAENAAVPHLVSLTLDRLAGQASLHYQDPETFPESWISIGQLRDDVLRDQHSLRKRTALWDKVKKVVEMNSNVRASQRESRNGEISRVWEWIGAVSGLDSGENRRKSGRVSWGAYDSHSSPVSGNDGGPEMVQQKWQEGRPIY